MTKEHLPILKYFGLVVREIRKERQLSQEELAGLSGLHRTYITDIERGTRNVSLKNITRIAQAVNISLPLMFTRFEEIAHAEEKVKKSSVKQEEVQRNPVEILLVEDDQNFIELTLHMFRQWNIANMVHVVRTGPEALEFLFTDPSTDDRSGKVPKVILLDLNIPLVDGFAVLRQVRSNPLTHDIPVVVLTSSSLETDKARCHQLGVEEFLTKPVNVEAFSAVMKRLGFNLFLLEAGEFVHPEIG
jgi:CheY-like chemotaxis protein/DNA-binding XRE family transcriptional regulator